MACAVNLATRSDTERVYFIAGSKGGVGKSMLAHVLIDQLRLRGKNILYFECDTANADVWHSLQREQGSSSGETIDGVTAMTVRLEEEEGWTTVVTALDEYRDHVGVIGGASRMLEGVDAHGHVLRGTLPELERDLVTLWVIDEQVDSLGPLQEHLSAFPDSLTHVVKNSHHGPDAFSIYEDSSLRRTIETRGGTSMFMPRLGLGVVTALYSHHLAISRAIETLPLAQRYLLKNFRKSCGQMLDPVLAP
jgi:MinD-like ATPase involved in chromosome partitioning or flagellar assembly